MVGGGREGGREMSGGGEEGNERERDGWWE